MTEFPKDLVFDRSGEIDKRIGYESPARNQVAPNYKGMTKSKLIAELETVLLRLTVSEHEHSKQYEMTVRYKLELKTNAERMFHYKQVIRLQAEAISNMARVTP